MIFKLTINGEASVDARKLTKLIHKASGFNSLIYIEKDERKANVKSLMGVLSLAIKGGDNISLIAQGDDEREAIDSLSSFINNGFSE